MLRKINPDGSIITLDIVSSALTREYIEKIMRDAMVFIVENITHEALNAFFAENSQISDVQINKTVQIDPETGAHNIIENEIVSDLSDYCIAGPITDRRDGTWQVIMGKRTEYEETIDTLMTQIILAQ